MLRTPTTMSRMSGKATTPRKIIPTPASKSMTESGMDFLFLLGCVGCGEVFLNSTSPLVLACCSALDDRFLLESASVVLDDFYGALGGAELELLFFELALFCEWSPLST